MVNSKVETLIFAYKEGVLTSLRQTVASSKGWVKVPESHISLLARAVCSLHASTAGEREKARATREREREKAERLRREQAQARWAALQQSNEHNRPEDPTAVFTEEEQVAVLSLVQSCRFFSDCAQPPLAALAATGPHTQACISRFSSS